MPERVACRKTISRHFFGRHLFQVSVNGSLPHEAEAISGAPRGVVLNSILMIIYVPHWAYIELTINNHLCADDVNLITPESKQSALTLPPNGSKTGNKAPIHRKANTPPLETPSVLLYRPLLLASNQHSNHTSQHRPRCGTLPECRSWCLCYQKSLECLVTLSLFSWHSHPAFSKHSFSQIQASSLFSPEIPGAWRRSKNMRWSSWNAVVSSLMNQFSTVCVSSSLLLRLVLRLRDYTFKIHNSGVMPYTTKIPHC